MRTKTKNDVIELSVPARLAIAISQSPRQFVCLITIICASLAIIINALFLQNQPHPAPIFASVSLLSELSQSSRPNIVSSTAKPLASTSRVSDPIAALIESPKRMSAVQRVLAELGYGQLKVTGIYNNETQLSIQKFERDRHLPITGKVSDRLMRELAEVVGRSLE